jgi:hypothetical protein
MGSIAILPSSIRVIVLLQYYLNKFFKRFQAVPAFRADSVRPARLQLT